MSDVEFRISAGRPEPSSTRLVATLAVAATLSGLALAGAYQVTLPTIEANKAERLQRAVFEVVPGSVRIESIEPAVYAAYDADDACRGYAIEREGPGFQDTIRLLVGYDPLRQRVIGMEVLQSRETPGLGDKIFKDEAFVAYFGDLAVDPEIVLVKDVTGAANEVDAITGATISSRAVVKIVNEVIREWRDALPPPNADRGEGG